MYDDAREQQETGIGSRVEFCEGQCGETGRAVCYGHDVWKGYE